MNATGRDDPALAETTWPMPDGRLSIALDMLIHHSGLPRDDMLRLFSAVSAYRALITDGTTARQQQRLAALRRVYRRRNK